MSLIRPLHSTAVREIAFEETDSHDYIDIVVQWSGSDTRYRYLKVPIHKAEQLAIYESKGQYLNWFIKPHYDVETV